MNTKRIERERAVYRAKQAWQENHYRGRHGPELTLDRKHDRWVWKRDGWTITLRDNGGTGACRTRVRGGRRAWYGLEARAVPPMEEEGGFRRFMGWTKIHKMKNGHPLARYGYILPLR